jgi:hypothetical protein
MPSLESFHVRKLSLSSRNGGGAGSTDKDRIGEAIYMTVVRETEAL